MKSSYLIIAYYSIFSWCISLPNSFQSLKFYIIKNLKITFTVNKHVLSKAPTTNLSFPNINSFYHDGALGFVK